MLLLLKALTGDNRYEEIIPAMQEEQEEKGGVSMCELLDKYVNKGMEAGMEVGRKAGMEVGMEVGRKEGMEAGKKAGIETVNELIRHLIGDGRSEEIARVVSDRDYQNRLFQEYGL